MGVVLEREVLGLDLASCKERVSKKGMGICFYQMGYIISK